MEVLAAEGFPAPLLCTVSWEGGQEQRGVPFDAPVVVGDGEEVGIRLESGGGVVGEVHLALEGRDLPLVGWVAVGERGWCERGG